MRIKTRSRDYFHGTHKGHDIKIERERPPVETLGGHHYFYIRVYNDHGHAYDGYSPVDVTTMAQAKREALRGACLINQSRSDDAAQVAGDKSREDPNA